MSLVPEAIRSKGVRQNAHMLRRLMLAGAAALMLTACQDSGGLDSGRAWKPIPRDRIALMQEKGTHKHAPILIRAFKKEAELEVWKMRPDGTYAHLKTYPVCRWSGQLGPKRREGDRQVPEGFYSVTPGLMNPNSAYFLSFNIGYPNAFDRAQGAYQVALPAEPVQELARPLPAPLEVEVEVAELQLQARAHNRAYRPASCALPRPQLCWCGHG
jgi:hypothetical protein